ENLARDVLPCQPSAWPSLSLLPELPPARRCAAAWGSGAPGGGPRYHPAPPAYAQCRRESPRAPCPRQSIAFPEVARRAGRAVGGLGDLLQLLFRPLGILL